MDAIVFLYSLTILVSSALLFWIEPVISKLLLPQFGGAPSVWTTCIVFFQGILFASYCYVNYVPKVLSNRIHGFFHLALALTTLVLLPISMQHHAVGMDVSPVLKVMVTLALTIGVPFFVIASTAPLIQRWFSLTNHAEASDPYFLYSSSNLGSMILLLSYPIWLEPRFTIPLQLKYWSAGYAIFVLLMVMSAAAFWRYSTLPNLVAKPLPPINKIAFAVKMRWVVFAFIPSSLLLAVTSYITTDVAAIPLLWILPLALYLLTFIITFAKWPLISHQKICTLLPYALITIQFFMLFPTMSLPILFVIFIHLTTFVTSALYCHGELAKNRPSVTHLTEFYFYLSLGGFLGGIFNTLVAPAMFNTTWEYPLTILLLCFFSRAEPPKFSLKKRDMAIFVSILLGFLVLKFNPSHLPNNASIIYFGIVLAFATGFLSNGLWLGVCFAILLGFKASLLVTSTERIIYENRNFFGTLRIVEVARYGLHVLLNGTTLHGLELLNTRGLSAGQTYYLPIKQIIPLLPQPKRLNVAIAGLGVGTLACYFHAEDKLTYYEINPSVVSIAQNPLYFNNIKRCAPNSKIILGDARINLERALPRQLDMLIADAFSSDAVPVHLLTINAVQMYLTKLKPSGLLFFNITNRHLDLTPILATIAYKLNLIALTKHEDSKRDLNFTSDWVVLFAKDYLHLNKEAQHLYRALHTQGWQDLKAKEHDLLWTDDYSNLVRVLKLT